MVAAGRCGARRVGHKALKKRLTAAFPINRDLYRYGQVSAYFAKAEAVVEQLAEQAPQLPAEKCLTLVDYALSRMDRALETIDDSGGFRFHCEATLQTLHVQTVTRLDWSPDKLAAYLYDKAFGGGEDMYPEIPDAYAEALGEAGMAAYHACLQRACDWLMERLDQTSEPPFGWAPRVADSLLELYLLEGRLADARALCAERAVSPRLLHQLARALKDPDESLPLYLRLVRHEVRQTNNQGYRNGIALLQEIQGSLETSAQREAFAQALIQLRAEFKQKRNFIKWLNEAFPA